MSQPVTFESGVHYVLQGVGYQVVQILDDGMLVARNLATNAHVSHRLTELWQQWQENTLQFARWGPNLQESTEAPLKTTYTFADLADLPPALQDITWHRYQLICPLLHIPSRQRTKQVVETRIRTYLSALEQGKTPGEQAFLRSLPQQCTTEPGQTCTPQQLAGIPTHDLSGPSQGDSGKPFLQHHYPAADHDLHGLIQKQHPPSSLHPKGNGHLGVELPSAPRLPLLSLSPRTVSRWLRRYLDSHEDIRSLVPSYHLRGPHHNHLNPLVKGLLQQAIKQTYLTTVRAPVTHVLTTFQALILSENTRRAPEEQLVLPGKMTVYRYLHQLDAKDVDGARKGQATASREHHQTEPGPQPTRPNQRAELDFARLDLLVVDPTDRLPIGRPTLAAIRDKYTGYPLGVFISFDPPSYRVAMECMLYAFLPKTHVKAFFHTQHEYLAFGLPEVLVVDNAIELDRDLELACLQLGIELQHMPVRKPWFKGSIERWFRTLNTDLIHVTPGTTFSHVLERGEYASEKHACITLDRLWELLHLWIVDVYTQEIHSGVGGHPRGRGVPAILWQQALEAQFVPRLPPSRNDLLVLVSRTEKRRLHHYGIEFEQLLYQDHALAALRSKLKQAKTYRTAHSTIARHKADDIQAGIIQIKYHPGDLSRIWVFDPFSDRYLEVAAVDKDYTEKLSLWKHRVIKRYAQQELGRQVNQHALVLAKARLQQFITDEMRLTHTIRSRHSMARWWNEQVTTWITEATQETSASATSSTVDTSQKGEPGTTSENEQLGATHEDGILSQHTPSMHPSTSSAADLCAPLPSISDPVALLADRSRQENQSPFESFPPLPENNRSPLGKPRRTRRASNKARSHSRQNTTSSSIAPGQEQLPHLPIQEREHPKDALAPDQHNITSDRQLAHTLEMASPLQERQLSFGIEIRSTPWR